MLKRLTVTIGGFKIELLPGPSYTQNVDMSQPAYFDEGLSHGGSVGFVALPDVTVNVQDPIPKKVAEIDSTENKSADDAALGLGPYVNPNDVQTSSPCAQETKCDNQNLHEKQKPVDKAKRDIKQPHSNQDNETAVSDPSNGKEKQQMVAKTLLKSKEGQTSNKNKDAVSSKANSMMKAPKVCPNLPSNAIQREELHKMKPPKEKKDVTPLKRPAENTQNEHATKMQKIQASGVNKVKSKQPSTPSSPVKKSLSLGSHVNQQGPAKHTPQNSTKVEPAHSTVGRPGHSLKTSDDGGAEKAKPKKAEKIHQRQKSKNARSISVDEPELFVPDNAPVVKKEAAEEQPVNSETVWDGSNCCGLCKQHHNNM